MQIFLFETGLLQKNTRIIIVFHNVNIVNELRYYEMRNASGLSSEVGYPARISRVDARTPACLTCWPCCWNKTEHHETSQRILSVVLLGTLLHGLLKTHSTQYQTVKLDQKLTLASPAATSFGKAAGFTQTRTQNPQVLCTGHERFLEAIYKKTITIVYVDLTLADLFSCWKCDRDGLLYVGFGRQLLSPLLKLLVFNETEFALLLFTCITQWRTVT